MLKNLNEYVTEGSYVKVIDNNSIEEEKILALRYSLANIKIDFEYLKYVQSFFLVRFFSFLEWHFIVF